MEDVPDVYCGFEPPKDEIYVGEFNKSDIERESKLYKEALEERMSASGFKNVKVVDIDRKGFAFHFHRAQVYLTR